uniref:Uncharacterized protein n=1 Tax=Romanomermis culicivorax TaxID=13658 RepID=A0A915KM56_ROMCU
MLMVSYPVRFGQYCRIDDREAKAGQKTLHAADERRGRHQCDGSDSETKKKAENDYAGTANICSNICRHRLDKFEFPTACIFPNNKKRGCVGHPVTFLIVSFGARRRGHGRWPFLVALYALKIVVAFFAEIIAQSVGENQRCVADELQLLLVFVGRSAIWLVLMLTTGANAAEIAVVDGFRFVGVAAFEFALPHFVEPRITYIGLDGQVFEVFSESRRKNAMETLAKQYLFT